MMPGRIKFPNRIKQLRIKKGWSQQQTATMADMSWRHYVRIEQGTTDPSAAKLRNIAQVLGCSVDDLYL